MAAYPFAQAPTTDALIAKLTALGATLATTGEVVGPRGKVVLRYLKRQTDNGALVSENLPDDGNEPVGWDKLRRVCRQLEVDPRDLEIPGLHLG